MALVARPPATRSRTMGIMRMVTVIRLRRSGLHMACQRIDGIGKEETSTWGPLEHIQEQLVENRLSHKRAKIRETDN